MTENLLAVLGLVIGVYLVHRADRMDDSGAKAAYAATGMGVALWSLFSAMDASVSRLGLAPVAFGVFAFGAAYAEGSYRAIAAAAAILLFLSIIA